MRIWHLTDLLDPVENSRGFKNRYLNIEKLVFGLENCAVPVAKHINYIDTNSRSTAPGGRLVGWLLDHYGAIVGRFQGRDCTWASFLMQSLLRMLGGSRPCQSGHAWSESVLQLRNRTVKVGTLYPSKPCSSQPKQLWPQWGFAPAEEAQRSRRERALKMIIGALLWTSNVSQNPAGNFLWLGVSWA